MCVCMYAVYVLGSVYAYYVSLNNYVYLHMYEYIMGI